MMRLGVFRAAVAFGALALSTAASAGVPEARQCLEANDVPCARSSLGAVDVRTEERAEVLALAAEIEFSAGEYDQALVLMQRSVDKGFRDRWDNLGLYQRTADVMKDFAEERRGRYIVRFRPGVDYVLLDQAFEVLEQVEANVAPLVGGPPPGPVILEIYPDGRSFTACSSLTEEDVETTGVVALSKWTRLLLTSPRALGRGYGWQDTIAHEYIHLAVAHRTTNRAPVWLQEAIAKYLDNRWRDGKDGFRLGVREQGLLATALREEGGWVDPDKDAEAHRGLVSFERMHPSLAKLPSADMAALAYAQLASLMSYAYAQGGNQVLQRALPAVESGRDPRVAVAQAAGGASFEAFYQGWLAWVRQQRLEGQVIAELPTVLDGGEDAASDPVMAEREDLQRWLRLGDLLREADRPKAALVEYEKAVVEDEPLSPLLANRIAQVSLQLGDAKRARSVLENSLASYPEFALTHKTLGQLWMAEGQGASARGSFARAVDLNPFDPEVQQALAELARAAGDGAAAARHDRYLRILRRGGPEPHSVKLLQEAEE
jgi:tetratricopeptide (TPR) repeat protein